MTEIITNLNGARCIMHWELVIKENTCIRIELLVIQPSYHLNQSMKTLWLTSAKILWAENTHVNGELLSINTSY